MLDLWLEARTFAAEQGISLVVPRMVSPSQLYGIEAEFYAHELASVVVWIGFLQWKHEHGVLEDRVPILQKLTNIQHGDAILRFDADGNPNEPDWPEVDFIVGNPPFVGGNRIRAELGDSYVDHLFGVYAERVPSFADVVCYWFEKARDSIVKHSSTRAGLLATQGIRGGANREVLNRVKKTGDIFFAQSDRKWPLDGALVRISMVGFDDGSESTRELDGRAVPLINSDLTSGADTTHVVALVENCNLCFMGPSPKGPFDIDSDTAQKMLAAPLNVNGRHNSDVVRRVQSGIDLVQRHRNMWTIDFGMRSIEESAQYEMPFEYIKFHVYPVRSKGRKAIYGERWWQYARPRVEMRRALKGLARYIATPATAKHRIFVWVSAEILCNQGTLVYPRSDDYFFGILHSKVHELWALHMGTQLESRPRYTPTSTFETFPFPCPPGLELAESNNPRVKAIGDAARELIRLRENWLNPPDISAEELHKRTLTNLYNERPHWLETAHERLDRAVFAAYELEYPSTREEILRHLLKLNHKRSTKETANQLPPKKPPESQPLVDDDLRLAPPRKVRKLQHP